MTEPKVKIQNGMLEYGDRLITPLKDLTVYLIRRNEIQFFSRGKDICSFESKEASKWYSHVRDAIMNNSEKEPQHLTDSKKEDFDSKKERDVERLKLERSTRREMNDRLNKQCDDMMRDYQKYVSEFGITEFAETYNKFMTDRCFPKDEFA